jgi:hypothetical protein
MYIKVKKPVSIEYEMFGLLTRCGRFWKKFVVIFGIRTPNRPARSELLSRLEV